MCQQNTPDYIWEEKPKEKVYQMLNAQINNLEKSTIISEENGSQNASENSIDMGFKLFPILETISTSIVGKTNTRDYLEELGTVLGSDLFPLWLFEKPFPSYHS